MYRPRAVALSLCVFVLLSLTASAQTRAARDGDEPVGDVRLDVPGKSVPRLVKFGGTLRDGAGQALSGTRTVTFALYGEQGSKQALWQEVQTVAADENGRYTVTLGATLPGGIPIEMFANGEARWLETRTSADGERAQRLMLVSVPFALKAEDADKLGGRSASEFVLTGELEQQVAKAVAERQAKQGAAKEGGQAFLAPDKPIGVAVQDIAPNGAARFQDSSVVEVVLVQQNGAAGFGLKAVAIGGSAIQAQSMGVGSGNATILAQATSTTGAPVAIQGESFGQTGIGVQGIATSPSATSNVGVRGEAAGTAGRGVVGMATAGSGVTVGVLGAAGSGTGAGVRGEANGVNGGTGVVGIAGSNSGNTIGVQGEVSSSSGIAGLFRSNNSGGKVLVGQGPGTTDVFTVDAGGNVTASGIVTATGGLTTSGMLNVGNLNVPSSSSASGLVKATNSGTGAAVEGLAAGPNNAGVYGRSLSGTGVGVLGESNASGGTAGMFNNTAGGKIISGQSNFVEVFSVNSPNTATNSAIIRAVQSGSTLTPPGPANLAPMAVRGESIATSGFTHGVVGIVNSPDGVGVIGGSLFAGVGGTGVLGITSSTSGDAAVAGEVLASTGDASALKGQVNSPNGKALRLEVTNPTATLISGSAGVSEVFKVDGTGTVTALGATFIGANGGVIGRDTVNDATQRVGTQGIADSNNGRGVVGNAPTTGTGNSIGVLGIGAADNSAGVLGRATSTTGTTSGVRGINFSSGGHAVRGDNYPPTPDAVVSNGIGVLGTYGQNTNFTTNLNAIGGYGVLGKNYAAGGYGVSGVASADNGVGVQADATSTTGFGRGVRGNVYSAAGMGVEGVAQNATGTGIGVSGLTNANSGVGVRGEAILASGVAAQFLNTAGTAGSAILISGIGDGGLQKFAVQSDGDIIASQVFGTNWVGSGTITSAGEIHAQSGGIRFPDNTVQTTAGGGVAGTGTTGKLAKFATANSVSDSVVEETANRLGVNGIPNINSMVHIQGTLVTPAPTSFDTKLLNISGTAKSNSLGQAYLKGVQVSPRVDVTDGYANYHVGVEVNPGVVIGANIAHSVVSFLANGQPTAINGSGCVVAFGIDVPNQQPSLCSGVYGFYQNGPAQYNYFSSNVGIGTSHPLEKLHIVGNILATGTITGNGSGMTNVATVAGSFTQAQAALTAIPITTLAIPASAGLYRASCYMVNTASGTGPNGVLSIYWTDDSGTAQTGVCATFVGGTLGTFTSGSAIVQSGASAITFDVTSHASPYKVYVSLERLM